MSREICEIREQVALAAWFSSHSFLEGESKDAGLAWGHALKALGLEFFSEPKHGV